MNRLSIAIPASLTMDTKELRDKTIKIGFVGRALAIFKVNEVLVYLDRHDAEREARLICSILSYMETPQYLRKTLVPLSAGLKYVGILPPLRTPHHPTESRGKKLKPGEFREGVVIGSDKESSLVEVGVEMPARVLGTVLPIKKRVSVKIIEPGESPLAQLVNSSEIGVYWGYKVTFTGKSLGDTLSEYGSDLVIATSKHGAPVYEIMDKILEKWRTSERIFVLFGSPYEGLKEILSRENLKLEQLTHFIVNTIPNQGAQTIRTEEAIYATLAIFNALT